MSHSVVLAASRLINSPARVTPVLGGIHGYELLEPCLSAAQTVSTRFESDVARDAHLALLDSATTLSGGQILGVCSGRRQYDMAL